jgi:uncharacterized protein YjbI with pentapeptide repeats
MISVMNKRQKTTLAVAMVLVVVVLPALVVASFLLWGVLVSFIAPETPSDRKDLIQTFAAIVAGLVGFMGAIVAVGGLLTSRRTLRQTRELDEQRRRAELLQKYFEQMGKLLAEHGLAKTKKDDPLRSLAQAQTLTALSTLDVSGKGALLSFLYRSALLKKDDTIVDLWGANLSGARLGEAILGYARLDGVNLRGANLRKAKLTGADLRDADLRDADLRDADLSEADLREADLSEADLSGANLCGTGREMENRTKLNSASLYCAVLRGTDLTWAYLPDVNLQLAELHGAKMRHADLRGADLEAAELQDADLSDTDFRPYHLRIGESLKDTEKSRWERSISGSKYDGSKHDFLQAELGFAKLTRANLIDADLRFANLHETELQDADLTRTNLQGATARIRAVVEPLTYENLTDEEEARLRNDLRSLEHRTPRRLDPLVLPSN